ncbi:MAG: amidohydrolase [Burkholderiales bacterium]|nr:amidohydrolase [Burkholderiales bacterium]
MTGRGLIDIHHHFVPPFYLEENREAIVESWGGKLSPPWSSWTPEKSIEAMDRNGISRAILSLSSPGVWVGDASGVRKLARRVNEYGAGLGRDHPGRYGLFASVPLPDTEGSLREIEHALDVLKADGIALLTSYEGKWLGDESYRPVLDELDRRGAVVFVHPTVPRSCRTLLPGVPPVVTEIPQDTSRAIANLLYSGTLSRCRKIRFIFTHAGGAMPITYGRMVQFAPKELARDAPEGIAFEIGRHHYDIAATAHAPAIAALRSLVPASQVLFGTDSPFAPAESTVAGMRNVGFSDRELRAIGRGNSLSLLRRADREPAPFGGAITVPG